MQSLSGEESDEDAFELFLEAEWSRFLVREGQT